MNLIIFDSFRGKYVKTEKIKRQTPVEMVHYKIIYNVLFSIKYVSFVYLNLIFKLV